MVRGRVPGGVILICTDDPRAAAEQFIKQHSLSESYIDQIHDFILAHKTS